MGSPVDLAVLMSGLTLPPEYTPTTFVVQMFITTLIMGSLTGIILSFGEEYGWRGFLQDRLIIFGKRRAVLLIGLIWGIWHWPVVWMGQTYPGQALWGTIAVTFYTLLVGILFSYAMLKSGAIWLVAFLHSINNQALSFFYSFVYLPENPVNAFGNGLWGAVLLIPIVLLIFLDPVWKK